MIMDYSTSVFEGDEARQAIILPGGGYTVDMPVLWYAATALSYLGWTCTRVTWPQQMTRSLVAPIATELIGSISHDSPRHLLLVGKSLGTMAMPVAVEHGLPGVWLTPVLVEPSIGILARGFGPDQLLVGGTADPYWDSGVAAETAARVTAIADADHSLQIDGDLDRTLAAIVTMARAISRFAADL